MALVSYQQILDWTSATASLKNSTKPRPDSLLISALKDRRSHDVFKDNQFVVYDGVSEMAFAPEPIKIEGADWFEESLLEFGLG